MLEKVQVGAAVYSVYLEKSNCKLFVQNGGEGTFGLTSYPTRSIHLNTNCSDQYMQETLWHEVLHCIFKNAGLESHDEKTIRIIAAGVCDVLRQNQEMRETY